MKRLATGITLLFTLVLSLMLAPASAQEATPVDPLMQGEGLELAVSRLWSIDYSMASPVASSGLPELQLVSAMAMRYETPELATRSFDQLTRDMAEETSTDETLTDHEVVPLDGIGDQASAIGTTTVEPEGTWIARVSIAREGQYLYIVMAVGADADRVATADDLLAGMVNDSDPGEGDGTFVEDGTSTGGPWDVLPTNDHPALAGMINYGDAVLFPEPATEG